MMTNPNARAYSLEQRFRWIPSPRFWVMQVFLLIVWGILYRALLLDSEVPGLDYSGIYTLVLTAKTVFIALWVYAGAVWLAGSCTPRVLLRILEGIGLLFYAGLMLWIGLGIAQQDAPGLQMHQAQFALGQWTWHKWITQSQLGGWITGMGTGFPLNQLNPPGASLYYWFVCLLTGGLMTAIHTYTLAVYSSYLLSTMAVYAAVRTSFGRGAALLLLIFFVIDSQNGLGFARFFVEGEWSRGMGIAFLIVAFAVTCSPGFPCTKWSVITAGLAIGFSILCDPILLVFHGLWISLLIGYASIGWFSHWLITPIGFTPATVKENRFGFYIAILLGLGGAGVYWIPLFCGNTGILYKTTIAFGQQKLGPAIVSGSLFPHSLPWVTYLGLAGALWGLVSKRRWSLLLSIFSFLLLYSQTASGQIVYSFIQRFLIPIPIPETVSSDLSQIAFVVLGAAMLNQGIQLFWGWTEMNTRFLQAGDWIWRWQAIPVRSFLKIAIPDLSRLICMIVLGFPIIVLCTGIADSVWRWTIHPSRDGSHHITTQAPFWTAYGNTQAWWDSLADTTIKSDSIAAASEEGVPAPQKVNPLQRFAINITLLSCFGFLVMLGYKRSWLDALQRSRLNAWAVKTELIGACLVTLGIIIFSSVYPFFSHSRTKPDSPALHYKGLTEDWVSKEKLTPDGIADLEFKLILPAEFSKPISSMELYTIDENGKRAGIDIWITRPGWLWKIAIVDGFGRLCNQEDGHIQFPKVPVQHLRLFVTNPYPKETEEPLRLECALEFKDGSNLKVQISQPFQVKFDG